VPRRKTPGKSVVRVPKAEVRRHRSEGLAELQAELFDECMEVVSWHLKFKEISPAQEELPEGWAEQYGSRAQAVFRAAKAGWMPSNDAPVALKNATAIILGLIKARSEVDAPRMLNVQLVTMNFADDPEPEMEVVDVAPK
jgi:hypothetical protein